MLASNLKAPRSQVALVISAFLSLMAMAMTGCKGEEPPAVLQGELNVLGTVSSKLDPSPTDYGAELCLSYVDHDVCQGVDVKVQEFNTTFSFEVTPDQLKRMESGGEVPVVTLKIKGHAVSAATVSVAAAVPSEEEGKENVWTSTITTSFNVEGDEPSWYSDTRNLHAIKHAWFNSGLDSLKRIGFSKDQGDGVCIHLGFSGMDSYEESGPRSGEWIYYMKDLAGGFAFGNRGGSGYNKHLAVITCWTPNTVATPATHETFESLEQAIQSAPGFVEVSDFTVKDYDLLYAGGGHNVLRFDLPEDTAGACRALGLDLGFGSVHNAAYGKDAPGRIAANLDGKLLYVDIRAFGKGLDFPLYCKTRGEAGSLPAFSKQSFADTYAGEPPVPEDSLQIGDTKITWNLKLQTPALAELPAVSAHLCWAISQKETCLDVAISGGKLNILNSKSYDLNFGSIPPFPLTLKIRGKSIPVTTTVVSTAARPKAALAVTTVADLSVLTAEEIRDTFDLLELGAPQWAGSPVLAFDAIENRAGSKDAASAGRAKLLCKFFGYTDATQSVRTETAGTAQVIDITSKADALIPLAANGTGYPYASFNQVTCSKIAAGGEIPSHKAASDLKTYFLAEGGVGLTSIRVQDIQVLADSETDAQLICEAAGLPNARVTYETEAIGPSPYVRFQRGSATGTLWPTVEQVGQASTAASRVYCGWVGDDHSFKGKDGVDFRTVYPPL